MRIPNDISLATYIRRLIKTDKLAKFYSTEDWLRLRQEVMDDCHSECQECLKHGRYTRADCVHHINEVRKRPDLALRKYFVDKNGKKQKNLVPLCNTCHNVVHDKLGKWQQEDKYTNVERW